MAVSRWCRLIQIYRLIIAATLLALGMLTNASLLWAQAKPATKAPGSFGINPEWVSSPEMLDALEELQRAGIVPGRKGSLSFFRWNGEKPPQLAHLGLWGEGVSDEVFARSVALSDLQFLSIYETNITNEGLQVLRKFSKLRSFSVAPVSRYEKSMYGAPQWSYPFLKQRPDRPKITVQGLEPLRNIATIESLQLIDAQLAPSDLAILQSWPKLGSIALSTTMTSEAVQHLAACKRVSNLTLGYREITADEIRALGEWKSLKKLMLLHAKLSSDALAALASLESLEQLDLEECNLTDDDLAHLKLPAKLTILGLKRNEIDGPGLRHLVPFQLKQIGLEFNNISNATLSELSQLRTLETLNLSYCRQIDKQGIESGVLQRMTHVRQLGIRGLKQVTDASLPEIVKMTHLKHITIRETGISWESVDKMKTAMPETVVFK